MQPKETSSQHPVLALSQGDSNGIGPEIILKSLFSKKSPQKQSHPGILLFAQPEAMEASARTLGMSVDYDFIHSHKVTASNVASTVFYPSMAAPGPGEIHLIPVEGTSPASGRITAASGKTSMLAVEAAVYACMHGPAQAIVTGPISKEAISKAGYDVPGHTEFLAQCTQAQSFGMILANDTMRIGLATIHIPLKEVPASITRPHLVRQASLFAQCLKMDFGIAHPRMAVLGLNPHAGDGGVLGTEEMEIIKPAIDELKKEGLHVTGPHPADGFFGSQGHRSCDLVLAMYHDQGLIPLKLSGFGSGVNITAGLPVIRTSPDHGTAFSLAGKGIADASSFKTAIATACTMIKSRSHK
ncbi:4-hydroxythreonine-4-phosphate dehydrogenase PdxA [Balneolaceae bacterium ANBcel3]|nr:4-hydroxythreonine-4-phosphate dehydrogenase PdxA [Balneolaceae bacterium ANBcel3]